MSEQPFEHILGVGQASTLNVDGGDYKRRKPVGFSAAWPQRPFSAPPRYVSPEVRSMFLKATHGDDEIAWRAVEGVAVPVGCGCLCFEPGDELPCCKDPEHGCCCGEL